MKEVCVLGLGYIGLPTAAMFAANGVRVRGVDIDPLVCETINNGKVHIEEPCLEQAVKRCVACGMLDASGVIMHCKNYIIAVPTPVTGHKKADLSFVAGAAESIYPVLEKGDLVILESTVPPGCTGNILVPALEKSGLKAGADFYVAHCPERVLPGRIIYELEHNSRVIGGLTAESAGKAKDLYAAFVKGEMVVTDTVTAELCKLMENTYRDVNIALANELAMICERLGANSWDVIGYANKHPRVNLHQPGPGVGGHCLAVDPWFIVESVPDIAGMIELSRRTNDYMPHYIQKKVYDLIGGCGKVVILGCTYKPDIGDIRESPVLELAGILRKRYEVEVVDPYVRGYDKDIYKAACGADLVILGVNHKQFEDIDFGILAKVMKARMLLDTRNCISKDIIMKYGFDYFLLGDGSRTGMDRSFAEAAAAITGEEIGQTYSIHIDNEKRSHE